MIGELARLAREVAEIRRAMAATMRSGTVAEVDAAAGTVRLDLGEGMLSAPVPYTQFAGALKVHTPPSVGQQMFLLSPSGETAQGCALPLTWGGGNDAPSGAANENVLTFGAVRMQITDAAIEIVVGGVTLTISAAGLSVNGGRVEHDGTNIGSTHTHGGVDRGGSNTDPPE